METAITNNHSEFGLIDWIQQQAGCGDHLSLGIGDDCAIQPQHPKHDLLTSTDLLIEGIHFRRDWTNMFDLGRKAAAVNISDIAAMGGTPQSIFLGIGRPKTISNNDIETFISGFLSETTCHGGTLAGGDTCGSPESLMISVTIQGTITTGSAICRSGANSGDAIYVSGTLGDSALALQLLQQQQTPDHYLAQRFHTPTPRVKLGQELATQQFATAMLDVSDGLIGDLKHILTASKVGATIELSNLPLSMPFQLLLETDPTIIDLALAGGEDYELVFTSPDHELSKRLKSTTAITKVGTITATSGLHIKQDDGLDYSCRLGGFDHFD